MKHAFAYLKKYITISIALLFSVFTFAGQSTKFNIPDGSAYICQNRKSQDMLIQLVYSRTSSELASVIVYAPTKRIDKVLTWMFSDSNQFNREEEYTYRNTNVNNTILTIYPKKFIVRISGDGASLEFDNCKMIAKEMQSSTTPSKGDYDRLNLIKKNGDNGWGYAQDVFTGDGYSYLLINPSKPNYFRQIKYINCLPDPKFMVKLGWDKTCNGRPNYYQRIISDEVISAPVLYKFLVDTELKSEYKDTSELSTKLSKEGWKKFRNYYVSNTCAGKEMATIKDFYNSSYDGLVRRVTLCNNRVIKDIKINSYQAEIGYYESGMYQGD